MLFVNDILMFGNGSIRDPKGYEQMLNIYGKTTSMEINATKLTITCNRFQPLQITDHRNFTTIQRTTFSCGYEYLGLILNEMTMVSRIGCVYTRRFKKRLVMWCKKCLFLGGILTLVKYFLEATIVYWLLDYIPKLFLNKIRKNIFSYHGQT